MNRTWRGIGGSVRLWKLIAAGVLGTLVLCGLIIIPDLIAFLPWWIRGYPIEWIVVAFFASCVVIRILEEPPQIDVRWVDQANWTLDRAEGISGKLLEHWLVIGFAGLSVLWLLLWIPHYLYWPWCRDTDSYALIAQEWDSGVLPYRDIRSFNFPGHIYLHWILGKLFGWGHTGVFNAFDASAVVLLGAVVVAWSRRRLGLALPGTIAYIFFLAYYLDISFELVGERDWHAPLCIILGLLLLDAWPGRRTRWLSAILAAVAFTIRPNVVLFFPALLFAAMNGNPSTWGKVPSEVARIPARRTILTALEWICVLIVFIGIGFAPLALSGLVDDLARGLTILKRGGSYSDATTVRSLWILLEELRRPEISTLVIGLLILSFQSSERDVRLTARVWLLALAGALAYRPIHPLDHGYLRTPLELFAAMAWAIPIAWLVRAAGEGHRFKIAALPVVLGIFLIVYESIPMQFPVNCSLLVSIDSVRAALTGSWPKVPPGAWVWYESDSTPYRWDAYCRLLKYVRENTAPTTIVANALKRHPFPSANGAVGRRSPFRVESGVPWMWVVAEDLDEDFARDLERQGCDSIVILCPEETVDMPRLPLRRLAKVIKERYVPEVRIGMFEVWRRRCETTEAVGPPSSGGG